MEVHSHSKSHTKGWKKYIEDIVADSTQPDHPAAKDTVHTLKP